MEGNIKEKINKQTPIKGDLKRKKTNKTLKQKNQNKIKQ